MDRSKIGRPQQFNLAVRSLYSQSLVSSSTQNLESAGRGLPMSSTKSVGSKGQGRPAFISQEILDQPVRRPATSNPPPLPSYIIDMAYKSDLPQFSAFFSGESVDDIQIYKTMEAYIFKEAHGLPDLKKMMQCFSLLALDCHRNVPAIFKYLYVFSQDPRGSDLRTAFFSNLESYFQNREDLKEFEGPSIYRNFIRWVMAAAHHYRNLLYAPFDGLMFSLLDFADEISEFYDSEDIPLYVTLVLRFYYYMSLPCSDSTKVSVIVVQQQKNAIAKARNHVRERLAISGLSAVQINWLTLLVEVTRSSPLIEKDIVNYYEKVLPGFSLLRPESLTIKLPEGCQRAQHLEHISKFLSFVS